LPDILEGPYVYKATLKVGFLAPAPVPTDSPREGPEVIQEYLELVTREAPEEVMPRLVRKKHA